MSAKITNNMADVIFKKCVLLWLFLVSFYGFFCSLTVLITPWILVLVSSVISVCAPTQKMCFYHKKVDNHNFCFCLFWWLIFPALSQILYHSKTKETKAGMFLCNAYGLRLLSVTCMLLSILNRPPNITVVHRPTTDKPTSVFQNWSFLDKIFIKIHKSVHWGLVFIFYSFSFSFSVIIDADYDFSLLSGFFVYNVISILFLLLWSV